MPRIRTHPGRVLHAEPAACGLNVSKLAHALRVPSDRITTIIRGERGVTVETAVRPGYRLGSGAAFCMNMQTRYDISVVKATKGEAIDRELAGAPNV